MQERERENESVCTAKVFIIFRMKLIDKRKSIIIQGNSVRKIMLCFMCFIFTLFTNNFCFFQNVFIFRLLRIKVEQREKNRIWTGKSQFYPTSLKRKLHFESKLVAITVTIFTTDAWILCTWSHVCASFYQKKNPHQLYVTRIKWPFV